MYRKAQNVTEMAILGAIVLLIAVATFTIYNNKKVSLVKMSEVTVTNSEDGAATQSVETSGRASVKKDYKYPSSSTSGGGTNTVTTGRTAPELLGMTQSEFEEAIANLSYNDLKKAASLINTTKILAKDSAYATFFDSKDQIGVNGGTLDAQISILSAIAAKDSSTLTSNELSFISKFKTLLNSADAYDSTTTTTTNTSHKPAVVTQAE